jgi:hypothetical protein
MDDFKRQRSDCSGPLKGARLLAADLGFAPAKPARDRAARGVPAAVN